MGEAALGGVQLVLGRGELGPRGEHRRQRRAGVAGHFAGVDFSEAMLEQCRHRKLYAELLQGDLNFGLTRTSVARFDLITACAVVEIVRRLGEPVP